MPNAASDLSRQLSENAEAVCRRYLSNGRREGRYWLVGDVANTPGRSLYVRLRGREAGGGAAGKWTDAATGEHGDLLDLIAASVGLTSLREVLTEARRFLSLPEPERVSPPQERPKAPLGSAEAARRLFAASRPIEGTLAETYLHQRGIVSVRGLSSLRFHPRCFYRADSDEAPARDAWPAMVAEVSDLQHRPTGVHRTWLDPRGRDKAPVRTPRRAMGDLLGHGVRFGRAEDVLAAGEGVETVLSLRMALPALPLVAALSAAHLAALVLPSSLRRLYLVQDDDPAGRHAVATLAQRAESAGVEPLALVPTLGDFNDDLCRLGAPALAVALRIQLAPEDVNRFWRGAPGI